MQLFLSAGGDDKKILDTGKSNNKNHINKGLHRNKKVTGQGAHRLKYDFFMPNYVHTYNR